MSPDTSKKNSTFKALDCTVQITSDSKKQQEQPQSQTLRVSEMDSVVGDFMGIERAILENVVFCHQEESNWPLLEQRVLKKKFDDIFGSTKYNKALQTVKQCTSDLNKKGVELRANVQLLGSHQQHAMKLRDRIKNYSDKERDLKEGKLLIGTCILVI